MASNEVWGIDVGKSGIKAIKMRRTKNKLEIVDIEIVEYEQAVSESEEVDRDEQIRQALNIFQNKKKIKNERIFVSIPGQATFNRLITIPPVEKKRIKEIVTYEAQQQIPFPIDEVLWDYQLIGDDKSVEEREVMLFAVRKEIIQNFLANLEAADIQVEGIQIAPLAIYNFVRYERPDMEAGVAIDIGAENTDLIVVDADKLWLRAVPYAGDDITKALQKRFNIPYIEAEKLKLKSGKTKQAKKIFEVMKPVLKDLVGEVHRSVGYYKSMSKDIKFEKMIFVGNATKLSGFEKFFSQNLQYEIEVLSQVQRLQVTSKINVNQFKSNIATFAVAMGLAIQGLDQAINNIRLLPQEKQLEAALKQQKPVLAVAVALLAIIPGYKYYTASKFLATSQKLHDKIAPQIKHATKLKTQLAAVQNYGPLQKELLEWSKIGKGRGVWMNLWNVVDNQYLTASSTIEKEGTNKIWMIGFDGATKEEFVDEVDPKDPNIKTTHRFEYLTANLEVVFKGLQSGNEDQILNLDYLERHLIKPLKDKFKSHEVKIKDYDYASNIFNAKGSNPFEKKQFFRATIQIIILVDGPPDKKPSQNS